MAELTVQQLSHYYGKHRALYDVNATIRNGIVALIGPNGAGKTTLINVIVGLLEPTKGKILLDQSDIRKMGRQYYNHIGYCPQLLHFYPNYTAEEFLMYIGTMKGMPKQQLTVIVPKLLEQVNLLPQHKKRIGTFSGGMKQRLGIAQALLNDPSILILDEPTAGLDPCERNRFRNMLSELSSNRIILIATHIISDIENIANQVLFLRSGNLIANGTLEQVLSEIDGSVWIAHSIDKEALDRISQKYVVSNVRQTNNSKYDVKIVGDGAEDPIFQHEKPTLEDAFLFHFHLTRQGANKCVI